MKHPTPYLTPRRPVWALLEAFLGILCLFSLMLALMLALLT